MLGNVGGCLGNTAPPFSNSACGGPKQCGAHASYKIKACGHTVCILTQNGMDLNEDGADMVAEEYKNRITTLMSSKLQMTRLVPQAPLPPRPRLVAVRRLLLPLLRQRQHRPRGGPK